MAISVALGAVLAFVLIFGTLSDPLRRWLVVALLALPPIGLMWEFSMKPSIGRSRIDIQFLGFEVPVSLLKPCGAPAAPLGSGGVWIGGGERWPDDKDVDLIALPGYRGHLIELCQGDQQREIKARLVSPGTRFTATQGWFPGLEPARYFSLTPAEGLFSEEVAMTTEGGPDSTRHLAPDTCISLAGGQSFSSADVISFVLREWAHDRDLRNVRFRTRLRDVFERRPTPDRNYVFCLDLARGLQRCNATTSDLTSAIFVWRSKGYRAVSFNERWDALLPESATWTSCSTRKLISLPGIAAVTPKAVTDDTAFSSALIETLPSINFEMIAHRTRGGIADVAVPLDNDRFSPAAFRRSTAHTLRFALRNDRLIIFAPEHSVQIRYDDLFGPAPLRSIPDGQFALTFGDQTTDDVLVANLAATADGLRPKHSHKRVTAQVRIPDVKAPQFSLSFPGLQPTQHRMGSVLSIPATPGADASGQPSALVVLRRISPPAGLLIVPITASLLATLGLFLTASRDRWFTARWPIIGLLLHVLTWRLLLTARTVTDSPTAQDSYVDFVVSACFLLIAPMMLFVPPLIASVRSAQKTLSRRAMRDLATLVLISVLSVIALVIAIARLDYATSKTIGASVAFKILSTGVTLWVSVSMALVTYAWIRKRVDRLAQANVNPAQMVRRRSGIYGYLPWISTALLAGVVIVLFRLLLLFLGFQESAFGLKLDVITLPIAAAVLTAMTHHVRRITRVPLITMIVLFYFLAFIVTGFLLNDLGLWWVGGMAAVLAMPFTGSRSIWSTMAALFIFLLLFISPKLVPSEAVSILKYFGGSTDLVTNGGVVTVPDSLQVNRQRDHYRLLDAIDPESLQDIPTQLAREVMIERERLRYQALEGAWREGLRRPSSSSGPLMGAGALQARSIVGETSFVGAAKSDYVYQMYVRSEYGTLGVLALLLLYIALFLAGARNGLPGSSRPFGLWSVGLAVGSGLFMLGGTHAIFPFSGKWPLFLAVGSLSDFCLGLALLLLTCVEVP
jgi:hypothetical protein